MKRQTWRKHHKWVGICLSFFLLMFCLSGIVLNHRNWLAGVDVSRGCLPSGYQFKQWNNGLMRGSLRWTAAEVDTAYAVDALSEALSPKVLVYGAGGIWLTDTLGTSFADFNQGLPTGADRRTVRAMAQTADGDVLALTTFGLYRLDEAEQWQPLPVPTLPGERLTDLAAQGDSIVALGRSRLYVARAPYKDFRAVELSRPADYDDSVTLFRLFWLLHSGELFGLPGQLVVDAIAIVIIVLIVTGWIYWLLPYRIRRRRRAGHDVKADNRLLRGSLSWHDVLGRWTIVLTLLLCFTGWCLRPPLLIPLAITHVTNPPGTILHSDNPWRDKLRMIAYDSAQGDWLLSTSAGFYALRTWDGQPQAATAGAPTVSVMGLNVLQADSLGRWLCGSFSGLYVWDRAAGQSWAYGQEPSSPSTLGSDAAALNAESDASVSSRRSSSAASRRQSGPSIAGYSADFSVGPVVVEYGAGTDLIAQPEQLSTLPISLWNLALEVHTGRIYIGSLATLLFVFITGAAALWCLWSGWKLRKRKAKRAKPADKPADNPDPKPEV